MSGVVSCSDSEGSFWTIARTTGRHSVQVRSGSSFKNPGSVRWKLQGGSKVCGAQETARPKPEATQMKLPGYFKFPLGPHDLQVLGQPADICERPAGFFWEITLNGKETAVL